MAVRVLERRLSCAGQSLYSLLDTVVGMLFSEGLGTLYDRQCSLILFRR